MFLPERWAAAFFGAAPSPEAAEEGLAAFKALLPPVEKLRQAMPGTAQALRLEGVIRAAALKTGLRSSGLEGAIRLITLLVKKNRLKYGPRTAERIEQMLNEKKGLVEVTLETAVPPEAEFEEALKQALIKKTGARDIRVLPRILPELLGGCRLRMGGRTIDASLRGQLAKLAADLDAAPWVLDAAGLSGAAGR
jgi:F-type H+-transporting ATPase subunit delta